jgi:hypothetical protein
MFTMEFYSSIRKKETMWFEDKWMELEDIILSKPDSESQKSHVSSHMYNTDPKNKHIHKNKHRLILLYM